jgi:hypothetical protein
MMIKETMVQTRFATGRAMFIQWMFSNRALGEQWVQRATRRAGSNGRQVASRKLQAGGGYGTIGQQTDRLQPTKHRLPTPFTLHVIAYGDL